MKQQLINISSKLVSYPSTQDNKKAINECFKYIESLLSPLPLVTKHYEHNGVHSTVWLTKDTLTPDILLDGHIDVVPAPSNMFSLSRDSKNLYGRGVADMKCAIASFILVIQEIYKLKNPTPSIGIMLTSDEEVGGMNGTNYLVNKIGYHPKIAIIPDGGENNNVVEMSKGVIHLSIIATGKTAHASDLWEGDNAIDKISQAIQAIRKLYPQPIKPVWQTTTNIGQISGGLQTNQVPDWAQIILDIRYIPDNLPEDIIREIQKACPECELKQLIHAQPFQINTTSPHIKRWMKLIDQQYFTHENGASDARYFDANKTAVILSSPNFGNIHAENEWIEIKSLVDYTKSLIKYITTF